MHLAMRSMRAMGLLLMAIGVLTSLPLMFRAGVRSPGASGLISLGAFMLYLLPGVLYFVFATYISRRRGWAVIAGLCLASLQSIFVIFSMIGFGIFLFGQSEYPVFFWIPMGICAILLLALVQLIVHLAKTFEALKYVPADEQRGFEPLMAVPTISALPPLQTGDANSQQSNS